MKRFLNTLLKILSYAFVSIIIWYVVYFFFGDHFSLYFTDRTFAAFFPQLLVFLTAVSIYFLFIFQIRASQKKWKNILLFVGGLLFALLPILIFHGYFQYRCGDWNREVVSEEVLYLNPSIENQSIKEIISVCGPDQAEKSDTVLSQKVTPYLEWNNPVILTESENAEWKIAED